MKKTLSFVVAFESLFMYLVMYDRGNGWFLTHVAYSLNERPYVYRVLLPLLSRGLEFVTTVDIVYCMGFLFVLSGVGFYLSVTYLTGNYQGAFIAFQSLLLLTFVETKVYDYATAMFFALSFALLSRRKHGIFLLLFPLATMNRETTFLLTAFYAVYFFGKIQWVKYGLSLGYQVAVYVGIKMLLQTLFAENGGQSAYITILDVVGVYSEFWVALVALIPLVYLGVRSWGKAPHFVRVAILVILPIQIALHVMLGKAFEFRVFAESVPLLAFLQPAFPVRELRKQVGVSVLDKSEPLTH